MIQTITIDNKEINLKVTGNTPKRYREYFNRDLLRDIRDLYKHTDKKTGMIDDEFDFGTIERLGYIMARQYDNTIGDIDEWLDGFDDPQAIYVAMPQIIAVWRGNETQIETPKK